MANIVTNANDVELILESGGTKAGTSRSMGRIVVDDFSISTTEGNDAVSGVGFRTPAGVTFGDVNYNWSFTLMGSDLNVFDMVANPDGTSKVFSFTARKTDDEGVVEFEFALDTCFKTDDDYGGTSGDPTEYSVEGGAVSLDRRVEL